jgi:ABC-type Fe3+ transport system, periplasmic component
MKKLFALLMVLVLIVGVAFAQGATEQAAAPKGKLTIYSAASEGEAEALVKAFNQIHPEIDVTIIRAGSGDLVTRVKTEWPKPDGDVILLMGSENLDQIYDKLEAYKCANHDDFAPENRDSADVPKYYGTSMPLQAIMYNTKMLSSEDAPKSWKDLADPKYKGEIVLGNPASSGSSYAQLFMMNELYGMDFVKQVVANATYVASSTAGPDSVARGEYAITVTGEMNIGKKIAAGDPVAYVLPEEGTGLRIEGSAILANCKNLDSAKAFIDFMTSQEAFQIVRDECFRRAVSTKVPGPEGLPNLQDMKFFKYDAAKAASTKKALVAEFNSLL